MTDDPTAGGWLRQGFKWLNRYMVLHWRLGLGPIANCADLSGCIMVLVHTGRKSGLTRRTPVNYVLVEGDVYCAAGFGQTPTGIVTCWPPRGGGALAALRLVRGERRRCHRFAARQKAL